MIVNRVTLITTTYKNWHLLDKAIASVARQIVSKEYEVEYFIVDDGTENFNQEYVSKLISKLKINTKLILNEMNVGTVASVNNVIKQSNGDIIVFLSADDEFYDENVIDNIVKEFVKTSANIITGFRQPVLDGVEQPLLPEKRKIPLFSNRISLLKSLVLHGNFISGASTAYSRSVLEQLGFFDERYRLLEDYPFYVKALSLGINIHFMESVFIRYGLGGVSTSKGPNPILQNDLSYFYKNITLELNEFSLWELRFFTYSRMMSRRDKILNAYKYPDAVFIIFFIRLFDFCRVSL
ncbi:glycosyltransferase [Aeromonas sp. ASNIH2]|uniref:glycosyltransferase n=1 Tax=Aeromonas sp. ASNIH2 TaxID=1636607 RepID=UPI000CDC728D|nr:glycosyltransferase [Aeromonas sp. ASNIH2]AUY08591.1 hypothetical protein C3F36_02745 [Aeromonas sp. ASNIH2]